jgi:hypothetical protein
LCLLLLELHGASHELESREGVVKGRLGVQGSSEVNGRGHVVMETQVDTGQRVVANGLDGEKTDEHVKKSKKKK